MTRQSRSVEVVYIIEDDQLSDAIRNYQLAKSAMRIFEVILDGPVPLDDIPGLKVNLDECTELALYWLNEIKVLRHRRVKAS